VGLCRLYLPDADLDDSAPGSLVPYGRQSYYKPEPLPPSAELEFDAEFYERLSNATFWLGKLSGISLGVDFPAVLYTSLLRKEAMESAEIEGADVDYIPGCSSKSAAPVGSRCTRRSCEGP